MSNMQELIKQIEPFFDSKGEKGIENFDPNLLEFEDKEFSKIEFFFVKDTNGEIIKVDKLNNQEPYVHIKGYQVIKNNVLKTFVEVAYKTFVELAYFHGANMKTINGSEWSCGSVHKFSSNRDIVKGEPYYVELNIEGFCIAQNLMKELDKEILAIGGLLVRSIHKEPMFMGFKGLDDWLLENFPLKSVYADKFLFTFYFQENDNMLIEKPNGDETYLEYQIKYRPTLIDNLVELYVYEVSGETKNLIFNRGVLV